MTKKLIPTEIDKENRVNEQKQEWDEFWQKRLLQLPMRFSRRFECLLYLSTILKKHKNANTFCELGCGSSILLTKLAKSCKKVVGIDYSKRALEESEALFKKSKIGNFQLFRDDVRNLKTKEKFDVVFSNGLVEHFDDPGKVIMNHLKITKEGGFTVVMVPYKYSFKNFWYSITRPQPLQRYWPWTEQLFFTKKSLECEYNRHCSNYCYDYEVSVFHPTENVVISVQKLEKTPNKIF